MASARPVAISALAYLAELRAGLEKTEGRLGEAERDLVEGLLPLSGARPGSPQPVHLYADHYWALLGWKEGRAAASLLAEPGALAAVPDLPIAVLAPIAFSAVGSTVLGQGAMVWLLQRHPVSTVTPLTLTVS